MLSAPARGYIYVEKHEKNCIKSDFKEIVLKLAANGQSDKGFLLTSTFVPKGLCPCPGAIYGVYGTTGPLVIKFCQNLTELFPFSDLGI